MPRNDPRVDACIARSAPFARPILRHLRAIVHAACPAIEEHIKWGMPSFEYKGPLCGMAAFKQHATFGFWKPGLILGPGEREAESAMGQFGCIRSLTDLPAKRILTGYVKRGMELNEQGIRVKRVPPVKPAPRIPPELTPALKKNAKARSTFAAFSPSSRRDYVEWITEAKQEATRKRRLEQAVAWMAEGKKRNWKYEKC